MTGFVVIHRKIYENPLFVKHPIARQVFEDLLKLAAWKKCQQDWRGCPVELGRGQVMISMRRLAEITARTVKQVRIALRKCEAHKMLILGHKQGTPEGNTKGKAPTIITICNYTQYQDLSNLAGNDKGTPEVPSGANKRTNNHKPKKELLSSNDDVKAAFQKFVEFSQHTGLPKPSRLTPKRKQRIKSRLEDYGLEEWTAALRRAYKSDFIRSARWFTIDWLAANETNIGKVLEGNYDNKAKAPVKSREEQADDRFEDEMRRKYLVS